MPSINETYHDKGAENFMGAKPLSVGKTGKMVDGHPHTVWEVLELGKSEASEDIDGFPLSLVGFECQVPQFSKPGKRPRVP